MTNYSNILMKTRRTKRLTRETYKAFQELVVFYEREQCIKDQCYNISKLVMKEIITLLKTDGINSKKEVLGILQTYVEEDNE